VPSSLFIASYLGLGVPAVLAGLSVVHGHGLVATGYEYRLAVIVLATVAAIGLIHLRTRTGTSPEEASR
jgi:hypothetical protein